MKMSTITNYWDKQAKIWKEEKDDAWQTNDPLLWISYFKSLRPLLSGLKVLEVGTASGYFANILALSGYDVTAVDISPEMIKQAEKVSTDLDLNIKYEVMDAQNLTFTKESYDFIFTRLMTWTLPNTELFYQACYNILKPQGILINFDGDMGKITFTSEDGHEKYPSEIMEEANQIKSQLEISKNDRPEYDMEILRKVGFQEVEYDLHKQNEILNIDINEPCLFQIKAIK